LQYVAAVGGTVTTVCECKAFVSADAGITVSPALTTAEALVDGTVAEVTERLPDITDSDLLRAAWDAENAGKNRTTLLEALTARIESLERNDDEEQAAGV
jgi:hypothetical protein